MAIDFVILIHAAIIGAIQGITEWLPVSSTGHMIIAMEFMPVSLNKEFWDFFLVIVQLFSMLAVLILFFKDINPFVKNKQERKSVFKLWGKIIIAVLPAAIIGIIFGDIIERKLFNVLTVSIALIIYGILFIISDKFNRKNSLTIEGLSYKKALYIGFFQTLALIPGTSRSGSTILGARTCGMDGESSAKFSFLLAIPTMLGAGLLKCLKCDFSFSLNEWLFLAVGSLVALIVSVFSVKLLIKAVKKVGLRPFGVYRIALGVFLILFFTIK